jgi:hypothetical protein
METLSQAEGRLRAEELAEEMADMRYSDRRQFIASFMSTLRSQFCLSCGGQPGCQCENDD